MIRIPQIKRFQTDDSGVALVEFAIVLPVLLLVFALIVEGSRMMLAYETAIAGVRDASRYLARSVAPDACATGASVSGYATKLLGIVRNGTGGSSVFPSAVTVTAVTPSYRCVTGSYRGGTVAVAQVQATVQISFPFAGLFSLAGMSRGTVTTTITDQSRVFGS